LIYYFLYTRIKENKSKETTPIITTSRIHPSLSVFTWSFGKDKEMDGAGCDNGRAVIYYKINNGCPLIDDYCPAHVYGLCLCAAQGKDRTRRLLGTRVSYKKRTQPISRLTDPLLALLLLIFVIPSVKD
jgi:hypothetical protein